MPATVHPARHPARAIHCDPKQLANSSHEILHYVYPLEETLSLELIQSSFDSNVPPMMLPAENGFVSSAIRAYSQHHHLKIRPDDIWTSILTQFSFFVNAHANELRDKFVHHEGSKELEIKYGPATRHTFDFSVFFEDMGYKIQENVIDPELREWIIPAFSTTTQHDVVVASIIMMSSMQKYFSYKCCTMCGLPSVTLEGEKADYELIAQRLEKLCTFGKEPTDFCQLLRPILRHFIETFERPDSANTKDFWQRIFKEHHGGSGPGRLSGWITAFCFWDSDGRTLSQWGPNKTVSQWGPNWLSTGKKHRIDIVKGDNHMKVGHLVIDGVVYPHIFDNDIPAGICKVPIKVDCMGDKFNAELIAGSVGINCSSSGTKTESGAVGIDTMMPQMGWWMYEKAEAKTRAPTKEEENEALMRVFAKSY